MRLKSFPTRPICGIMGPTIKVYIAECIGNGVAKHPADRSRVAKHPVRIRTGGAGADGSGGTKTGANRPMGT